MIACALMPLRRADAAAGTRVEAHFFITNVVNLVTSNSFTVAGETRYAQTNVTDATKQFAITNSIGFQKTNIVAHMLAHPLTNGVDTFYGTATNEWVFLARPNNGLTASLVGTWGYLTLKTNPVYDGEAITAGTNGQGRASMTNQGSTIVNVLPAATNRIPTGITALSHYADLVSAQGMSNKYINGGTISNTVVGRLDLISTPTAGNRSDGYLNFWWAAPQSGFDPSGKGSGLRFYDGTTNTFVMLTWNGEDPFVTMRWGTNTGDGPFDPIDIGPAVDVSPMIDNGTEHSAGMLLNARSAIHMFPIMNPTVLLGAPSWTNIWTSINLFGTSTNEFNTLTRFNAGVYIVGGFGSNMYFLRPTISNAVVITVTNLQAWSGYLTNFFFQNTVSSNSASSNNRFGGTNTFTGIFGFGPAYEISGIAAGNNYLDVGTNTHVRLTGTPGTNWTMTGIKQGTRTPVDGDVVLIEGDTGWSATIANESASLTTGDVVNRIRTYNGGDTTSSGDFLALAFYKGSISRWQWAWWNRGSGTASSTNTYAVTNAADVAVTSLAEGHVLLYNAAIGKWTNAVPAAGGGGSGSGETNFLGNAGATNSSNGHLSLMGSKVGPTNQLLTVSPISNVTLTNEAGTNIVIGMAYDTVQFAISSGKAVIASGVRLTNEYMTGSMIYSNASGGSTNYVAFNEGGVQSFGDGGTRSIYKLYGHVANSPHAIDWGDSLSVLWTDGTASLYGITNFGPENITGVLNVGGVVTLTNLTASRPVLTSAGKALTSGQIDLANANHVTGVTPIANGGTAGATAANARTNLSIAITNAIDSKVATPTEGQMLYFNAALGQWTNAAPPTGTQTPWASDINAATFSLTNAQNVQATNVTVQLLSHTPILLRGGIYTGTNDWQYTNLTANCSISFDKLNAGVTHRLSVSNAGTFTVTFESGLYWINHPGVAGVAMTNAMTEYFIWRDPGVSGKTNISDSVCDTSYTFIGPGLVTTTNTQNSVSVSLAPALTNLVGTVGTTVTNVAQGWGVQLSTTTGTLTANATNALSLMASNALTYQADFTGGTPMVQTSDFMRTNVTLYLTNPIVGRVMTFCFRGDGNAVDRTVTVATNGLTGNWPVHWGFYCPTNGATAFTVTNNIGAELSILVKSNSFSAFYQPTR